MSHATAYSRRQHVAIVVYAAVSVWAMASLQSALLFQPALKRPGSARVAVRASVKPAPLPTPVPRSDAILPLKAPKASAEKSTPRPAQLTKPVAATPSRETAPATPPPAEQPQELPTLEQPSLAVPRPVAATQALPALPALPTSEVPPMPGAQPTMPTFALAAVEKAGGEVLVLALLINDLGVVEDTSIVVPSRYALGDMTMALAYRGQKWVQLDPPMMPGERRWLELRIDHAGKDPTRGDNLP